ncbi:MAG: FAD-dependent oxidoreductase [Pelagibacteraceae bacterium TMED267]|nr:MAG: FAD-dependent oxidoreductase [Pelagibacteraceae bacterium TMED267]|tara:strand:- start:1510 stop:2745 length:1236 start_codon:yes stop_codon:yes gene_type:complete
MKIAVVGSGISGLSAAYYLSKKHHVDLYEKEDHFGGHSHTIDLTFDKQKISVDIGFIVFNFETYPNLINFFKENEVEMEKSNMSFSVSVDNTNFEYCGNGLKGIFSNKLNIFNYKFLQMFFDIIKFYKKCDKIEFFDEKYTLGEYLKENNLSQTFIDYHLIPMVSAIWSMPPIEASKMPIKFFLKFFQNHGLFKLKNRPQWYTVSNRSRSYVEKIISKISGEYFKNYEVNKIHRKTSGIDLYYGGANEFFNYDKVVIATHADEAISLIDKPTQEENEILSNFSYKENIAFIHTDKKAMPKNKKAWCSWNSSVNRKDNKNSITYWLNLLQNLKCKEDIFLTLNPYFEIDGSKVLKKVKFTHPYFDQSALNNQIRLNKLQNKKDVLYCGSYFGYGFHEDGINSSIEMLKYLND